MADVLLLFVASLLACLAVVALTIVSVRRDARWLGNAYLIGLSGLLILLTVVLALPGVGVLLLVSGVLALVLAPLSVLVLVSLLIGNGLTMIRKESRTLPNLLSLIAGLGITAVMAVSMAALLNPTTPLLPLALAAVLALAYVGFEFTCFVAYAWAYARIARRAAASHVIVLGSGLKDGRTVGPLLAGRVDAGIEHYRRQRAAGHPTKLVLSGGRGPDEHVPEAKAMADYAAARGVPTADLLVEDQSRNTLENLRFSREVIAASADQDAANEPAARTALATTGAVARTPALPWFSPAVDPSMLIVTSDYHALRAATYARQLGLPAHAVGAKTASYYWPSAILREFAAILNRQRKRHLVLLALVALPLPLLVALIGLA